MVVVCEVLGLGLGVAPLIIEVLKANPAPIYATRAMRAVAGEEMIKDFYTDLCFELGMLKRTLRDLVEDLPIDDDTKAKLTREDSLDASVWRRPSPQLQLVLEQRLSPCLEAFKKSMEKILYLLAKLVKDRSLPVGLAEDQVRVCTGRTYARLEDLFDSPVPLSQRIKFAWVKGKRDKLINGISKHNKRLQMMLEKTSSFTPSVSSHQVKPTGGCRPHLGLRKKMTELCQAIGRAWCECTGQHELRFGLTRSEIEEAHITLDMLMNLSKDQQKFQWGESKMKIHLEEFQTGAVSADVSFVRALEEPLRRPSSQFTDTTIVATPEHSPRSPRRDSSVAFANFPILRENVIAPANDSQSGQNATPQSPPRRSPPRASPPLSATRHRSHSATSPHPDSEHVDDICKVIGHSHRKRRLSEILFYEDKLYHSPVTKEASVRHNHPGVCLTHYIADRRKLTLGDRKLLSVLLAHSVLFFPWKGPDLNKETIAFHHEPPNKPFASLDLDHTREGTAPEINANDPNADYRPYPNEVLAALATVLLEIELAQPIEDRLHEDDVADTEADTRFWTTIRVLEEHKSSMYQNPINAIEACLRCDFTDGPTNLDDIEFMEQVYERIILPLEEDLFHVTGIRMSGTDPGHATVVKQLTAQVEVPRTESPLPIDVAKGPKVLRIVEAPLVDDVPAIKLPKQVRMAQDSERVEIQASAGAEPPGRR